MIRKLTIALFALLTPLSAFSQNYVAGYQQAKEEVLRSIPAYYIDKARQQYHLAFQRTSHGSHTSYGVYGLPDYKTGDDVLFAVSQFTETGKLEFRDEALVWHTPAGFDFNADLARPNEWLFVQTTRNFLDDPAYAHINVIMWAWCDIAGRDPVNNYFPGMDSLMNEYGPGGTKIGTGPGQREVPVYFIFMTGHPNTGLNLGPGNPEQQAQLIVNHCQSHGYFCLDYYSIDSHDMDDVYWNDVGDNGNSAAYGGNFYMDWQASHVLGTDYYENKMDPGGVVNYGDHLTQHITANRKAYAFWWILARMAGWDGNPLVNPVTGIQVSAAGGATSVDVGGTLQFSALVQPADASNKEVIWSVVNGSGQASISQEGLLTALSAGSVEVVATAADGSGVSGSLQISITEPVVKVSSIIVSPEGGLTEMITGETLQFTALVLPADAEDKSISWSVTGQTGEATITQSGLLTAVSAGTVIVVASALDGSGVTGVVLITISDGEILVSSITVNTAHNQVNLLNGESLQCTAEVLPVNATNPAVEWSVTSQGGEASISQNGLLTAVAVGQVTVVATALDGSGVQGSRAITISPAEVAVSAIQVHSENDQTHLLTGEHLQFHAVVLPEDATNKQVSWQVNAGTGQASITGDGLLTAVSEGTVEVQATAQDGSGVSGTMLITISSGEILVSQIQVSSENGQTVLSVGDVLQCTAEIGSYQATNKRVIWSVHNLDGQASVSQGGRLSAITAGLVDVVATAQDGSGVSGSLQLSIHDTVIRVSSISITDGNGGNVIAGFSLQMYAEIEPEEATNRQVTWNVENLDGMAGISQEGVLNAVAGGKVRVLASAKDGSGISASKEIHIDNPVLVESIRVYTSGGITAIPAGGTLQCHVEYSPSDATDKSVVWSVHRISGDADITQSGLLIGGSPGKVGVVATTCDCSGIRDTVEVDIFQPVTIDSISISSATGRFEVRPGEFLQLYAHIDPVNATHTELEWTVRNETGEASIHLNGLVKGISVGQVIVSAYAIDGSGIWQSVAVNITDRLSGEAGTVPEEWKIYPNPARGNVFLETAGAAPLRVDVLDPAGRVLRQVKPEPDQSLTRIDLSGLPPASYLMRITSDQGIYNEWILVH